MDRKSLNSFSKDLDSESNQRQKIPPVPITTTGSVQLSKNTHNGVNEDVKNQLSNQPFYLRNIQTSDQIGSPVAKPNILSAQLIPPSYALSSISDRLMTSHEDLSTFPTLSLASSTASLAPTADTVNPLNLSNGNQNFTDDDKLNQLSDVYSSHKKNYGSPFNTFYSHISIKIEQPVTSLSISPLGRLVVLAAKRGLYIVDLDQPDLPPRVIHHLTNWEVSDVQWNPHKSRENWIATTSNQKAIVWNLYPSTTSNVTNSSSSNSKHIQCILSGHQRAISDLNWSPFHPELLSTCSYDTYVHLWDLRKSSDRPVMSFCAWTAGATQVKFNKRNEWLLASSHDTDVKIWDMRKPTTSSSTLIMAHMAKINGIDWSRKNTYELATCAQDGLVKVWDVTQPRNQPLTIDTGSPVWRARFTPFGNGIVSMPQKRNNNLLMWDTTHTNQPVHTFSGHTDIVREFVWRQKGPNLGTHNVEDDVAREYQLVTWSKDQHLCLWPINVDMMKSVNYEGPINFDTPELQDDNNNVLKLSKENKSSLDLEQSSLVNNIYGDINDNDNKDTPKSERNSSNLKSKTSEWEHGIMKIPESVYLNEEDPASDWLEQARGVAVNRDESPSRFKGDKLSADLNTNTITTTTDDENYETYSETNTTMSIIKSISSIIPRSIEEDVSLLVKQFTSVNIEKVDYGKRLLTITLQRSTAGGVSSDQPTNRLIPSSTVPVFLRIDVKFPAKYPNTNEPVIFTVQKTGMISLAGRSQISQTLEEMAYSFAQKHKPVLIDAVQYLIYGTYGNNESQNISRSTSIPIRTSNANRQKMMINNECRTDLKGTIGSNDLSNYQQSSSNANSEEPPSILANRFTREFDSDSATSTSDDDFLIGRDTRRQYQFEEDVERDTTRVGYKSISNVPFPKLCGASFSPCGKLVCFYSPLPHPSVTKFTSYTLTTRNQQPILQSEHFTTQPKTYSQYENYRSFLLSKVFKTIQTTKEDPADGIHFPGIQFSTNINGRRAGNQAMYNKPIGNKQQESSLLSASQENKQSVQSNEDMGMLKYWLDSSDSEDDAVPSVFWRPKTGTSFEDNKRDVFNFLIRLNDASNPTNSQENKKLNSNGNKIVNNENADVIESINTNKMIGLINNTERDMMNDYVHSASSSPKVNSFSNTSPKRKVYSRKNSIAGTSVVSELSIHSRIVSETSQEADYYDNFAVEQHMNKMYDNLSSSPMNIKRNLFDSIALPKSFNRPRSTSDSKADIIPSSPRINILCSSGAYTTENIGAELSQSVNSSTNSIHELVSNYSDNLDGKKQIGKTEILHDNNKDSTPAFKYTVENTYQDDASSNKPIIGPIVSIIELNDILPISKKLAMEYKVADKNKSIPMLCNYNERVALENGREDVARIWCLIKLLFYKSAQTVKVENGIENLNINFKKNGVNIRSKFNSIPKLVFEDDESIDDYSSNVKWYWHPFGAQMISSIFDYLERLGDVQTLALLSIFIITYSVDEKEQKRLNKLAISNKQLVLTNNMDINKDKIKLKINSILSRVGVKIEDILISESSDVVACKLSSFSKDDITLYNHNDEVFRSKSDTDIRIRSASAVSSPHSTQFMISPMTSKISPLNDSFSNRFSSSNSEFDLNMHNLPSSTDNFKNNSRLFYSSNKIKSSDSLHFIGNNQRHWSSSLSNNNSSNNSHQNHHNHHHHHHQYDSSRSTLLGLSHQVRNPTVTNLELSSSLNQSLKHMNTSDNVNIIKPKSIGNSLYDYGVFNMMKFPSDSKCGVSSSSSISSITSNSPSVGGFDSSFGGFSIDSNSFFDQHHPGYMYGSNVKYIRDSHNSISDTDTYSYDFNRSWSLVISIKSLNMISSHYPLNLSELSKHIKEVTLKTKKFNRLENIMKEEKSNLSKPQKHVYLKPIKNSSTKLKKTDNVDKPKIVYMRLQDDTNNERLINRDGAISIFEPPKILLKDSAPIFEKGIKYICKYIEQLNAWGMFNKRAEILNTVTDNLAIYIQKQQTQKWMLEDFIEIKDSTFDVKKNPIKTTLTDEFSFIDGKNVATTLVSPIGSKSIYCSVCNLPVRKQVSECLLCGMVMHSYHSNQVKLHKCC